MPRDPPQGPPPKPASAFGRLLAGFHPAPGHVGARDVARVFLGCGLAAMLCGAVIALSGLPGVTGWFLIAPFGASAFLVVVVPNSPLAQPWPLVVGSVASVAVGLLVTMLLPPSPLSAGLALGGAVTAMLLLRAMHPPGGAASLLPILSDALMPEQGLGYTLLPVLLQSALLVGFGIGWHRLTGRVYPFRQPAEAPPSRRRLSPADLEAILERMRLAANIGVADFARLLAAADAVSAAEDRTEGLACADAAGPMPPRLAPDTPLETARALMLERRDYSLPVTAPDGRLLGVLSQSDILRADARGDVTVVGGAMTRDPVTLAASDPLGAALSVLASGGWRAVPLVDAAGICVGMLTRADLLVVLASPLPAQRKPLARIAPKG